MIGKWFRWSSAPGGSIFVRVVGDNGGDLVCVETGAGQRVDVSHAVLEPVENDERETGR
jgi:hypothetical protein